MIPNNIRPSLFSVLALIGLCTPLHADVLTEFLAGGPDAPSTTVSWTNLGGPVNVSAVTVGSPTVDAARNSFTESGASGTINLDVTALDDIVTPFDPATWTGGGTTEAEIHTNTSGWGVNDSTGNGILQTGEALILTFDLSGLTLGAGDFLVWTTANLSANGTQIWKRRPNGTGRLISSGNDQWTEILDISDGDTFAIVNAGRLQGIVLDVVPDLDWDSSIVYRDASNRMVYVSDENGSRVPDFSHAGYHSGDVALPNLPVVHTIGPIAGDNTAHIQSAIDVVAAMPPDGNGHRGALLLTKGLYEASNVVYLNESGIVVRGEGNGSNPANDTIIRATGTQKRVNLGVLVVQPASSATWEEPGTRQDIVSEYLPVGSRTIEVEDGSAYSVGDYLVIEHFSTHEWLLTVNYGNTDGDPAQWPPVTNQNHSWMYFHGTVTAISGNKVKLDTPLYHALDRSLSQATVHRHTGAGIISESGVENLRLEVESLGGTDENHRADCLHFLQARNCWAKDVVSIGFAESGVRFTEGARITVIDCSALDPVSQITGGRRYNFYAGKDSHDILMKRCLSRRGRHCYVINQGAKSNGIVATQSTADRSYSGSENHLRWGSGFMWDDMEWTNASVTMVLGMYNRGSNGTAHGWTGTNQVAWNIKAPGKNVMCSKPPIGQNYAIGGDANITRGNYPFGFKESNGAATMDIPSLYEAQLAERQTYGIGPDAPARLAVTHYKNTGTLFAALEWSDIALDEDNYVVERSTDGGSYFSHLATLPADTESYVDTAVSAGASYVYRVKTVNAAGSSAYGNTASVDLSAEEAVAVDVYHAEYFSAVNNVDMKWDRHDYTGEGYMNMGGSNSWFEIEVDGGMGGTFPVTFRYSGDGADPRPCDISVNGVLATSATFTSTGGWDNWATETHLLTLGYGTNTIRIQPNSGAFGPDVDRIDVGAVPVYYSAESTPSLGTPAQVLNAFDGDTSTLWRHASPLDSWIQKASQSANEFLSYKLTSGTGAQANDPADWQLFGSNNGGATWDVLDTRSGVTFSSRQETQTFNVASSGSYLLYRLHVTAVQNPGSADSVQLAELELSLPPVFGNDPFTLPHAFAGNAYRFSIAEEASDPNNNPLTYSIVSGPAWLSAAPDGTLSGTPAGGDAGHNSWIAQVSDGTFAVTATMDMIVNSFAPGSHAWAFRHPGTDSRTIKVWHLDDEEFGAGSGQLSRLGDMTEVPTGGMWGGQGGAGDGAAGSRLDSYRAEGSDAVGSLFPTGDPSFTIEGWFKFNSLANNLFLFSKSGTVNVFDLKWRSGTQNARLDLGDPINSVNNRITNSPAVPMVVGEWYHIAGTWDAAADRLKLFVDGEEIGSKVTSGALTIPDAAEFIRFGGSGGNDDFDGVLDEFRISDVDRTFATIPPDTPLWAGTPIYKLNATVDSAYSSSIDVGIDVIDPEHDALTFSLVSAPSWLAVASDGTLSGTPTVSGTYNFTIRARDTVNTADVTLIIEVVGSETADYQSWQGDYFTAGEISGGDADRGIDFDNDGYSNDFEYYFGLDPKSNIMARLPVPGAGGAFPTITYTRRIDLAGQITYTVETSGDLSAWTARAVGAAATDLTIISGPWDNGDGTETISLRYNTDFTSLPGGRLFFRVTATE